MTGEMKSKIARDFGINRKKLSNYLKKTNTAQINLQFMVVLYMY